MIVMILTYHYKQYYQNISLDDVFSGDDGYQYEYRYAS